MLDSAEVDGESVMDVLSVLAVKESVEKLDSSVPVRALFDRVSGTLVAAGEATCEDIGAKMLEGMTTEDMLQKLESLIQEGGGEKGRRLAKMWIQRQGENGGTVLCRAAQEGHDVVMRALIEAGADINKADDGHE